MPTPAPHRDRLSRLRSMKKSAITRVVQIVAVLTCLVAPFLTFAWLSHLGHIYKLFYADHQAGQPLPALTLVVLALLDGPPLLVRIASVLLITVCFVTA